MGRCAQDDGRYPACSLSHATRIWLQGMDRSGAGTGLAGMWGAVRAVEGVPRPKVAARS